ncbi:MAG: PilZ domain-containing protein [Planctomycetota bacterium]
MNPTSQHQPSTAPTAADFPVVKDQGQTGRSKEAVANNNVGNANAGNPTGESDKPSRASARFMTDWSASLKSHLIVGINDQAQVFDAEIADISLTGCAVRCSLPHGVFPQVGVIRIFDHRGECILEAAGQICWGRQTNVTTQTFGIRFRCPIRQEILDDLVESGWVSRREHAREEVDAPIAIRRTAGKPCISEAQIIDRSQSGLCFTADKPLEVNEMILVSLPSGASGMVVVMWCKTETDGHRCGALFQNLTSSQNLNQSSH